MRGCKSVQAILKISQNIYSKKIFVTDYKSKNLVQKTALEKFQIIICKDNRKKFVIKQRKIIKN